MNRKERRAQSSRATGPIGGTAGLIEFAATRQAHGHPHEAIALLKQVLAREPGDAAAHAKITIAYQAVDRPNLAVRHFRQAIWSGLKHAEALVRESPAMIVAMMRFANAYPRPLSLAELLGSNNAVADDPRLLGLLQSEIVRDVQLELYLTAVRRALLVAVTENEAPPLAGNVVDFACALAEQCFLNEYVYSLSDPERDLAMRLKQRIIQEGAAAALADFAVLGCYLPLHTLPDAAQLLGRRWPKALRELITRQVHEPLEEAADIASIPVLTAIEDKVSQQVQDQYEENPYPRWFVPPPAKPTTLAAYLHERFGVVGAFDGDMLIAGCGTGEESIDIARNFPQSNILAIDISRTSLAYARRKTRELAVRNVEYAQADIIKLGSISRRFDYIESLGVLHHMSDPEAGWRVLLSLLRPGGVMRIALYSEIARRTLDAGRRLIAERGYRPTADDIRLWRQELIQRDGGFPSSDFFNTSSCRDLCFHVMEHRFTLPRIKRFLDANRLTLLGMETSAETRQLFLQENPAPDALTDLDRWHAFEQAHPLTFTEQYYLWLRASASGS
jgi:SAM-dependent methyltransferase